MRTGARRLRLFDSRFVRTESRRSYRMACLLFWSLLLYFFCQRYVTTLGVIKERSMLPTLAEDSTFLVNKYIYHLTRPKRGDIIVLRPGSSESDEYVKRVIGLPGETIQARRGRMVVDGRPLDEPYVLGETWPEFGPLQIPLGRYFVMGDNRAQSEDSRAFGPVSLKQIEGRITPGRWFDFW